MGALPRHPMQPVYLDEHGTARFRKNPIVDALVDVGPLDLNKIALECHVGTKGWSLEDYTQLMQLIGYSVSGYGDLSTSPPELVAIADIAIERLLGSSAPEPDPSQELHAWMSRALKAEHRLEQLQGVLNGDFDE